MSATATWFLLAFLGAAPQPGSYEVIQDEFRAEKKEWGLFCGELPKVKTSPKGTRIQLSVNGDKWVFSGGNRYFGSRICEGTLPHLGLTQQKSLGDDAVELSCATRRVTRGTERTTQTIRHGADGNVAVEIQGNVESRKDGDLCLSTFVWKTTLAPKNLTNRATVASQSSAEVVDDAEEANPAKRSKKKKTSKTPSCKKPGPPVSLEIDPDPIVATSPSRRVCVQAQAQDKNGCSVKLSNKRLKYKVFPKGAGRINRKGCFRLSSTHRDDTNISIVARYKRLKATARVLTSEPLSPSIDIRLPAPPVATVVAPAEIETGDREEEQERTDSASASPKEARAEKPSAQPAPEVPTDAEEAPSEFPTGILLVLAILFVGGGGALGFRQRRNAAMADVMEQIAALEGLPPTPEPIELGDMVPAPAPVPAPMSFETGIRYCANCGSEFASGGTETCPIDGEILQWRERRVPELVAAVPPNSGAVCPTCFTRYDANVQHCYRDGTQLVPDFGQYND